MASAFTHAFVAAGLAAGAPESWPRRRLGLVLAAAACLPDADVFAHYYGVPYVHPFGHRGFTHSLPFAVGLGLFAFLCLWQIRPTGRRLAFASMVALACASHGLLDAWTDAGRGVGFWIPFSTERYFLPWRPIPASPIGIRPFFTSRGAEILLQEALWVWLPLLVVLVPLHLRRLGRRRQPSDS